ncbi:hypothetical protein BJ322DRAFT_1040364 [Thelephora terrestris]|uniref:DUF6593 domain-containing protein n=1 Tax=Thelephora terrestris TaxID=56493 RepID=A0A9P6HNG1_9AGAM|nr:hypothetical protein BJ322DRAFT_1040364 [Thelephora terrestris]
MNMSLSFAPREEDDILDTTILDSETGSVMYTVGTPKHAEGALTTTVTRRSQVDGSARFAFKIVWKGVRNSLKDVMVVLDSRTLEEVPVREVLKNAPGGSTYGSVRIDDVEYRWKTKGTGSKVVLVNKVTGETVAQSHSRIRSSFFRKPRDMSLEISEAISHAVDVVLLTFILVWRERQTGKLEGMHTYHDLAVKDTMTPLPIGDGWRIG